MHLLEVGKPYNPKDTRFTEASLFVSRGGEHELLLFMKGITHGDLEDYRSLPLELGFTYQRGIVNLLWKPESAAGWSDSPFSPWIIPKKGERTAPDLDLAPEARALLCIVVISSEDGIVRSIRMSTMSPEMTRELHKAIADQMTKPISIDEYRAAVNEIYREYPSSDKLAEQAVVTCKAGE